MLPETTVASFLVVCLACFFSVNLHNVLRMHKHDDDMKPHAEIEHPSGFTVGLAALGTFVYFAETLAYSFLVFTKLFSLPDSFPFHIQPPFMLYTQIAGIILTALGYFLFIWSVITRGKYAVSWTMRDNHKLVTWGPYSYVRHPSYLAYFLMFIGLFTLLPSLFTLAPLTAIPGYFQVSRQEEELLTRRFGKEYEEYQKKTGRFIPKL
jgi:protein-S-isoprenylcysteine O-methyltransferase Ste14